MNTFISSAATKILKSSQMFLYANKNTDGKQSFQPLKIPSRFRKIIKYVPNNDL